MKKKGAFTPLTFAFVAILIIAAVVIIAVSVKNNKNKIKDEESSTAPETVTVLETSTVPATMPDYAYAYAGFNPKIATVEDENWNLLLVNRNNILPKGYENTITLEAPLPNSDEKIDSRVAPFYRAMYEAAKKEGLTLNIISGGGFRTFERQETKFNNKIQYYIDQGNDKVTATIKASEWILPPGTSEHNAGLAVDICALTGTFGETKEYEWLMKNAADYGFILRYPEDKTDITLVSSEPWHWRYVGKEYAKKIKKSGMCLEEYLEKNKLN